MHIESFDVLWVSRHHMVAMCAGGASLLRADHADDRGGAPGRAAHALHLQGRPGDGDQSICQRCFMNLINRRAMLSERDITNADYGVSFGATKTRVSQRCTA